MIWQCSCSARVEVDSESAIERTVLYAFVKAHRRHAKAWRPAEALSDVTVVAQVERRPVGFYYDEPEERA